MKVAVPHPDVPSKLFLLLFSPTACMKRVWREHGPVETRTEGAQDACLLTHHFCIGLDVNDQLFFGESVEI